MTSQLPPQSCPDFVPSPRQIKAACRQIQATWDEPTERSRRTGSAEFVPYELPEVSAKGRRRRQT